MPNVLERLQRTPLGVYQSHYVSGSRDEEEFRYLHTPCVNQVCLQGRLPGEAGNKGTMEKAGLVEDDQRASKARGEERTQQMREGT